jgi:ketosteroid isomerase-like protein
MLKKIKSIFLLPFLVVLVSSCEKKQVITKDEAIQQIYAIEQAFNDRVASEGIAVAFEFYAAEEGSINRNDQIITGKSAIREFYNSSTLSEVKLTWKPDFVDLSEDLTMAYSYGNYTFSGINVDGQTISSTGLFHTVWKKQQDGSWRFVYD